LAQEPEGLSAPQGTANLSLRIFYVNRLSKQDWRAFFMRKFSNNQKEDKVMKKLSILFMVIFIFGLSTVGNVSAEIDVTKLLAEDGAAGDAFGYSVAVYGDTAVIGARLDADKSGSAYVFVRSGGTWAQQFKLTATVDDGAANDRFGQSVAVYGDTAVIGAYGAAYVFVRSGNTWTQQTKLTVTNGADDQFGYSVAVYGDTAVIGAYGDDDKGLNSGSAYVFKLTPSDIDTVNVVEDLESNCQLSVEILLKLTSPLGVKGMSTKKLNSLPGVKGMISKLTGNGSFAAKVAKAENDYANGNIDTCTYLDKLDGALGQLEGYDEQLEDKIHSGKIVDPEASKLLQTYSENMWNMINDLISDAAFSCSE
jgi:hypothetical protein